MTVGDLYCYFLLGMLESRTTRETRKEENKWCESQAAPQQENHTAPLTSGLSRTPLSSSHPSLRTPLTHNVLTRAHRRRSDNCCAFQSPSSSPSSPTEHPRGPGMQNGLRKLLYGKTEIVDNSTYEHVRLRKFDERICHW